MSGEIMLLHGQLVRSSVVVTGSRRQERMHPALTALAEKRRLFACLTGRLQIPERAKQAWPSAASDAAELGEIEVGARPLATVLRP